MKNNTANTPASGEVDPSSIIWLSADHHGRSVNLSVPCDIPGMVGTENVKLYQIALKGRVLDGVIGWSAALGTVVASKNFPRAHINEGAGIVRGMAETANR